MGAHLTAPSLEPFGLPHRYPEIHRDYAKGHKAHVYVGRKHKDKRKGGAGEQGQEVYEEVLDRAGEAAHALVYTGLDFTGGVFIGTEKSHPEGEHLLDDGLGEVPGHEDSHPLTVVVLRKGDEGAQDFLSKQDYRYYGKYPSGLRPGEIRADKRVYGINRAVQHDCVHLLHH